MALDVEKSTAKISEAIQKNELNDSMELPFETKKPATVEHSDADKLGIKSLGKRHIRFQRLFKK